MTYAEFKKQRESLAGEWSQGIPGTVQWAYISDDHLNIVIIDEDDDCRTTDVRRVDLDILVAVWLIRDEWRLWTNGFEPRFDPIRRLGHRFGPPPESGETAQEHIERITRRETE
jgi:hypothetical protein